MTTMVALTIAVVFAAGVYCLLGRCLMRLVIGLILLSQGANLLVFTAGGLVTGRPGLVADGSHLPPEGAADALPQALVLTAIVIGFGLTLFAASLLFRARQSTGNDDVDAFNRTDAL